MRRRASLMVAAFGIGLLACAISVAEDQSAKPESPEEAYLVGEWTIEGSLGDKKVMGNMRVRPGAGGTCLNVEKV